MPPLAGRYQRLGDTDRVKPATEDQRLARRLTNLAAGPPIENATATPRRQSRGGGISKAQDGVVPNRTCSKPAAAASVFAIVADDGLLVALLPTQARARSYLRELRPC
jgi:hypothetical protein